MSSVADDIATLVELLRDANHILVFTGAGVSTGSGIRDFRGPKGVWKERQPVYFQDFVNSEAARLEYWDQKCQAWPSFQDAQPNPVHTSIADLERAGKLGAVLTQNIDGLHHRGGTSPERLVEIHGTNAAIECLRCHTRSDPDPHMRRFAREGKPPLCECGGYLKTATISFGQNLDPRVLEGAAAAVEDTDLVVGLGSTLSVYPAAEFPLAAARRGVPYVVINRGATEHDGHAAVTLRLEGDVVVAVSSRCHPGAGHVRSEQGGRRRAADRRGTPVSPLNDLIWPSRIVRERPPQPLSKPPVRPPPGGLSPAPI